MKKLFLLSAIIFGCDSDKKVDQRVINYEGVEILVGEVTPEGLQEEPFLEWYSYFYEDYQLDSAQLQQMADELGEIDILVFLGTWCDDSQYQVPGFLKMLAYAGFDFERLRLIALERNEDRVMFSPDGEEENFEITHVPTFIFYRNGKEVGRIVENPMQSLEKDMWEILNTIPSN